jgi:hypothetical protein
VFVAERSGGAWSGLNLPTTTSSYERAEEVTARRGKATVLVHNSNGGNSDKVYARTQR